MFFRKDSMFLLNGSQPNMQALQSIIDEYCRALGQSVNLGKSSIFLSLNVQVD